MLQSLPTVTKAFDPSNHLREDSPNEAADEARRGGLQEPSLGLTKTGMKHPHTLRASYCRSSVTQEPPLPRTSGTDSGVALTEDVDPVDLLYDQTARRTTRKAIK